MKEKFTTLKELLAENNGEEPSYEELLYTKEWRDFRKLILKRDNHQCQKCHKKGNELAWEMKMGGVNIYVRQYDELEKNIYNSEVEYSSQHVELHVHHKYYIKDHYPWRYLLDALITVCMQCHENIHDNEEIPVYLSINKETKLLTRKCAKCNGTGYIKVYKHYMRGRCFSCEGKGYRIV